MRPRAGLGHRRPRRELMSAEASVRVGLPFSLALAFLSVPRRLVISTIDGEGRTGSALLFDWTVDREPPRAPTLRLPDLRGGAVGAVEVTGEGEPGATAAITVRSGRDSVSAQARVDESGH